MTREAMEAMGVKALEQEPCDNCKYLDGDGCRLVFEQIEYGKASDECPRQKARSKMKNELYQALTQHYYNLQSERKACGEQINVLEAKYKAIDEQMVQVNDILCKHGNHIYEHFEESEDKE